MTARYRLALLSFIVCMTPALAQADLPPPDDYVEECTQERAQARTRTRCELCGLAYHAEPEACAQQFAGTSMSKECQSYGASTWDEVWCDSSAPLSDAELDAVLKQTEPSATSADKGQRGCGCTAPEHDLAPVAALACVVALFGLGLTRRR